MEPGRGYAEVMVAASPLGVAAMAEAGWRARENLALYATGRFTSPADAYVGAGARLTW